MNNIIDLRSMKIALWAVYFHLLSSNENPQHGLCPAIINTWCKFQKTEAECNERYYDNKLILQNELDVCVKSIFRDLGKPMILRKCLNGKTQKPNDDNQLSWKIHILHTREIFRKKFKLFPLIGRNSELTRANKVLLFTAVMRPILANACPRFKQPMKVIFLTRQDPFREHHSALLRATKIFKNFELFRTIGSTNQKLSSPHKQENINNHSTSKCQIRDGEICDMMMFQSQSRLALTTLHDDSLLDSKFDTSAHVMF
ncbi:uncharacterized protein TNCV_1884621 [Trichonephila clavipes]|nr:uncharacterized protein TNCV_1884621 [Trichonephila clavipes]